MTTVKFKHVKIDGEPQFARVKITPVASRSHTTPIVLPDAIAFNHPMEFMGILVAADLPPTGEFWCYHVAVSAGASALTRYVAVPDVESINFADLPIVDPDTLEPSTDPVNGWQAAKRRMIVGGHVEDDDLILESEGGFVNAGSVRGRRGEPGPPGKDSTVPGPPGKDSTVPGPPGKDSTVPGPPGKDSTVPGPPGKDSTVPGPPGKDSTVPGPPGADGRLPDSGWKTFPSLDGYVGSFMLRLHQGRVSIAIQIEDPKPVAANAVARLAQVPAPYFPERLTALPGIGRGLQVGGATIDVDGIIRFSNGASAPSYANVGGSYIPKS